MNAPVIFAFGKDEIQMIREDEFIGFREEQWA